MAHTRPEIAAAGFAVGRGRTGHQLGIELIVDIAIDVSADAAAIGEGVVELDVDLVAGRPGAPDADEVVEDAGVDGGGKLRQDLTGDRAEAVLRNAVTRERVSRDAGGCAAVGGGELPFTLRG